MASEQILLARQAIYDLELNTVGYELLFRPSRLMVREEDWCPDYATSQVILHTFTELDTQVLNEGKPVYINFSRNLILNKPKIKPKDIVIEVLEDIEPDELLKNAIRLLVKEGYTIALDDFVYHNKWDEILELIQIVKVDVLSLNKNEIIEQVDHLERFNVILLAEKVENHEMFEFCKDLGFKYFQGYFLCHPQCVRGRTMPASRLAVLKLLSKLQDPEIEVQELEKTIAHDPGLSIKLLRIFTSSAYVNLAKIESIQHAITMLGLNQLKSWASLIALSRLDDKPSAIILTALNRARFCESLANHMKLKRVDRFFTAGLFSLLDALFDNDLAFILEQLPLSAELVDALLHHEGEAGKILQTVIQHERAEWDKVNWKYLDGLGVDEGVLESSYVEALKWSSEISRTMFNQ